MARKGRGSLATWMVRVTALVLDWAACTLLMWGLVSAGFLPDVTYRGAITLGLFFLEATLGTMLAGGSLGQIITRIAVVRLDGEPVGLVRAVVRTVLICLVIPAVVIGVHRRGLHDLAVGTVVVKR